MQRAYFRTIGSVALGAGMIILSACGDDANDQGACGHGDTRPECGGNLAWDYPEGGEIRVEYMNTPAGKVARSDVFLLENSAVPAFALPAPGQCNDIKAGMLWPWAQASGRVYKDIGSEVQITGAGTSMTLTKSDLNTPDFIGRTHDTWYRFLDQDNPVGSHIPFNGNMSANVDGEAYDLFMPALFNAKTFAVETGIELTVGQDYPLEWEMPQQNWEGDMYFIVVFVQPEGEGFTHICNGANTGSFTVPASTVAQLPENGLMILGVITHEVKARSDRRFDLLALNCLVTPFTVAP